MANNTDSNVTRRVMRRFIPAIQKQRVVSRTVNTQLFQGQFNPASGDYVDIKRPHQYKSVRTTGGDISATSPNDIISGKATAQVQNYITVFVDWTNKEEALSLDQLDEILKPMAEEAVTELETSFIDFMIKRVGLASGDLDQPIDAWSDLAAQKALLKSLGAPAGTIYSVVNPFVTQNLADVQKGLYGADTLIKTAWQEAQISSPLAGVKILESACLSDWTCATAADRAGALTAAPTATYLAAKDSMTQVLAVTGFTAAATLKAGDVLEFPGTGALARSYIHQKTRKTILNGSGDPIPWRCTVTEDVLLGASGEGNVTVTGPAIYETSQQYNTISAALTTGDVVNVLGTSGQAYQPNLFYHRDAFAIAFVKLPKLFSTDTVAWTSDGISCRVSKYSNGDGNSQTLRIDLLPAFACLNPFFAGKGFGFA